MICPECKGRGVNDYYVEFDRNDKIVSLAKREGTCRTCNGSGRMPMTNADRIRALTDEELCDGLFRLIYAADPATWFCHDKEECREIMERDELIPDEMCKACLLAKLKKPVDEPQPPVRFHMDKQESGLLEED